MGTHKILVNGTAFAVTAGTELINGTICKTGGGRTLVNGTAFDVKFSRPITVTIHGGPKVASGTYVQIGNLQTIKYGTYEATTGTEITVVAGSTEFMSFNTKVYYNGEVVKEGTSSEIARYSFTAAGDIDIYVIAATSGKYFANQIRITES